MAKSETFEKTDRSTVRRATMHADYDKKIVYDILDSGYMCHIAFTLDGKPFLNPTLYWRHDDYVYWHGLGANRMMLEQAKNVEVCFNVSHMDGLLLGKSAFHHSANYRSVTIYGKTEIVEGEEDKVLAAARLIENFFPGRLKEVRGHNQKELKSVMIMRLPIKEVSCKHRYDYSVIDILEKQESDSIVEYGEHCENPECWTGLIPIRTIVGDPIPDRATAPGVKWPSYVYDSRFKTEFSPRQTRGDR